MSEPNTAANEPTAIERDSRHASARGAFNPLIAG
jgi:hypothetical protein